MPLGLEFWQYNLELDNLWEIWEVDAFGDGLDRDRLKQEYGSKFILHEEQEHFIKVEERTRYVVL